MEQQPLGWPMHEAYVKAHRAYESRVNDVFVWIEEALAEAKKTFETSEILLIPKTPSTKRRTRKQSERNPAATSRSLRSSSARNKESCDSGVDFPNPRKTKNNRKTSRIIFDDTLNQLDSIRESLSSNEDGELQEMSHDGLLDTTNTDSEVAEQRTTRQKSSKQKAVKQKKLDKSVAAEAAPVKSKNRVVLLDLDDKKNTKTRKQAAEVEESPNKATEIAETDSGKDDEGQSPLSIHLADDNEGKTLGTQHDNQVVCSSSKENVLASEKSMSSSDQKLSEEFHLKKCSVSLGNSTKKMENALSTGSILPINQRSYFPSPHSDVVSSHMTSTSPSSSSTAGGRLLDMVKTAVGALLRRTGSPSSMSQGFDTQSAVAPAACSPQVQNTNAMPFEEACSPAESSTTEVKSLKSQQIPSSRRSSSTRVSNSGPKLSISKRRSSAHGNKARLAAARKSRSSSVRKSNCVVRLSVPLVEIESQKLSDDEPMETDGESSENDSATEIMDTPPQRVTRSKMRHPPQKTADTASKQSQNPVPAAGPLRVTRSKMRPVDKPKKSREDGDNDDNTPTAGCQGFLAPNTPATVVKVKPLGQRVQQIQKQLCQNPSFGLANSVQKATTASTVSQQKTRKRHSDDPQSGSDSPPKRNCLKPSFFSPTETSRQVQLSGSVQSKKTAEVHSFLKKKQTTPVHNNVSSVITSFLQKTATPKILTREEILDKKRRELDEKNKKAEEMMRKRAELLQRRAEEQRRMREEQHQQVLKRRQEMERDTKKTAASSSTTQLSEDSAMRMATRQVADDRIKTDQQEKVKIRDKRIAEAEQRRKQEEEAKKQMLIQQEREKLAQEEQVRRRREQEELERQQKLAEQRRQEEERRARMEREKQLEAERQRQLEEQRLREEQERQRAKEERERKEKAEKERQEMERLREKERQRVLEIERKKEMERIRIAEEKLRQEDERRIREEQLKTQKYIEKHNSLCKQGATNTVLQNSTANLAKKDPPVQTSAVTKPVVMLNKLPPVDSALNRTFNKETTNSDSYELTPVMKKVYKTKSGNAENYDISDLNSEDSTDEEDKPRKRIPSWAEGTALKVALINQSCHPPDLAALFPPIDTPDLNEVFTTKRKPRFNKRTSSAIWDASILLTKTP